MLNNIAAVYLNKEEVDKAIKYLKEALELKTDGSQKAIIYHNLAEIYVLTGDYENAIQYFNKSIDIKEKRRDYHRVGETLLELGETYRRMKDYKNAFHYLDKGLKLVKEIGDKYSEAAGYDHLGALYEDIGDIEKAKEFFTSACYLLSSIGANERAAYLREKISELSSRWSFAIITDLHIGRNSNNPYYQGEDYYLTERLKRVVDFINNKVKDLNIKFVVVLGDISEASEHFKDHFKCRDENSINSVRREFKKAKEILDQLQIPYIPILGNHDLVLSCFIPDYSLDSSLSTIPYILFYLTPRYFMEAFIDQYKKLKDQFNLKMQNEDLLMQNVNYYDNYKVNFRFIYNGVGFIALDFVNRDVPKTPRVATSPKAKLHNETLNFLKDSLKEFMENGIKKIIILAHNPVVNSWGKHGLLYYCPPEGIIEELKFLFNQFSGEDLENLANKGFSSYGISDVIIFAGHIHNSKDWERVKKFSANRKYKCKVNDVKFNSITTEALILEGTPDNRIIRIVTFDDEKGFSYNQLFSELMN